MNRDNSTDSLPQIYLAATLKIRCSHRHNIEEIDHTGLERVLSSHNLQTFRPNELLQQFGTMPQMID
jgi:hypothetical protein